MTQSQALKRAAIKAALLDGLDDQNIYVIQGIYEQSEALFAEAMQSIGYTANPVGSESDAYALLRIAEQICDEL